MTAPAKRGPGRPRKVVADVPVDDDTSTEEAARQEAPAEKPKSKHSDDDRIGEEVDPAVEFLSFEDGREYRCADGVITERVT